MKRFALVSLMRRWLTTTRKDFVFVQAATVICLLAGTAVCLGGCAAGSISNSGAPIGQSAAPINNGAPAASQVTFNSTVEPIISAKCAGCHVAGPGPAYLGSSSATYFDDITSRGYANKPASGSILLSKGPHSGGATSTFFTEDEKATITAWIDG